MPILTSNTLDFISRSAEQTRRLGVRLGSLVTPGDIIRLSGDLGSGKTTFVQGFAQGWGSLDPVSSPTFVIVNQYRRLDGGLLHHLDAYRIESIEEAIDLDLDEMLVSGVLVVEWAERIGAALPVEGLEIRFAWVGDEQRNLVFTPVGDRYNRLLTQFRQLTFGG
jgi:tRNA threonylcarbamoyladenosine biosynthesis protein TsaE